MVWLACPEDTQSYYEDGQHTNSDTSWEAMFVQLTTVYLGLFAIYLAKRHRSRNLNANSFPVAGVNDVRLLRNVVQRKFISAVPRGRRQKTSAAGIFADDSISSSHYVQRHSHKAYNAVGVSGGQTTDDNSRACWSAARRAVIAV